jgi:hypothetical protein
VKYLSHRVSLAMMVALIVPPSHRGTKHLTSSL